METKLIGYLSLVIILWASLPAISKLLLARLDNFQLLFYMLIFAVLGIYIILISQRKLKLLKKYSAKDILTMICMGAIGIFLYDTFLFRSFMLVPVNEAFILNYLYPIVIVILSIPILKEKFTLKKLFAILLSFIGASIVITQGKLTMFTTQNLEGYVMAIGAALCWGLFSVVGKKRRYETFSSMFIYLLSALVLTTLALPYFSSFITLNLTELIGIFYLGAITMGLAFALWFKALSLGETAKIANSVYLIPFISLVFVYFLIGEQILLSSLIGLVLIISGILVQNIK